MRLTPMGLMSIFLIAVPEPLLSQDTQVVHNVRIVTMSTAHTAPLEGMALVIRGKYIEAIRPEPEALGLTGARRIDGEGGFVTPGLTDAHVHHREHVEYGNYLAHGVTTVLGLGQGDSLASFLEIRDAIESGELEGPKIYTTGHTIANHIRFDEPAPARDYVRSLANDGLDFIKVYNNIPRNVFDAVAEEGEARGLSVFGHLPRTFPVEHALAHGLDVVAHAEEFYFAYFGGPRDQDLDSFDGSELPDMSRSDAVIDIMLENEVALIANLHFTFSQMKFWDDVDTVMADPEIAYLHPDLRESWLRGNSANRANAGKRLLRERVKYGVIHEFTRRAHEAGVLVVAGTDAPLPAEFPGKGLHSELRELVKAGLGNEESLATATRNAGELIAKYVDASAKLGVMAPGYEADLVLFSKNPLEDIRNLDSIAGVMKDGVWMDRRRIDELRAAAAARARDN